MTKETIKASDCECCICDEQAVAFWPIIDPDIQHYPYCRKCLDEQKTKLIISLSEAGLLQSH